MRNDAKAFRFCRSKCHKNFKMKRNPRKLAWTKAFRRAHGKEMTVDSTLAFAQRRNIPVRYNRDLVARTLQAMQRVSEIRSRREKQFYRNRMKGVKEMELEADRKLVRENQHLLPPKYRDQVQQVLEGEVVEPMKVVEKSVLVNELEDESEDELEEDDVAGESGDEPEEDEVSESELELKQRQKVKTQRKLRLVRGDQMDVDE